MSALPDCAAVLGQDTRLRSPAPLAGGSQARAGSHLHDVDVVRFTTVLGVLCVHATSLMLANTEVSGGALALLHVTREVFLFLSAFVLAYSSPLPIVARSFWRRRFPLVIAPYVVWSLIYVMADGKLTSPLTVAGRAGLDLLDGGARFHLYFLLLTFQLYLVFPWARSWLARRTHHGRILVGLLIWQLLFTSAIHYRLDLPGPLATWLNHPGSWLTSYILYVAAGVIAASHFDQVRSWIDRYRRPIVAAAVAVAMLGLVNYELDVRLGHMSPVHAAGVFAPNVVVESVAAIAVQFALGLWIARRAGDRLLRLLRTSSDVSFGVYLAHPLLYQGFLALLAALGVQHGLADLPAGAGLALVLVVIAPATYAVTALSIWLLRRTSVSLAFTGRRFRRPPVDGIEPSPLSVSLPAPAI